MNVCNPTVTFESGFSALGPPRLLPTACTNDRYWHLSDEVVGNEKGPITVVERTRLPLTRTDAIDPNQMF
jgi:hypothetical protein